MKTISKSRKLNDFHRFLLSNLSAHDYDRLDIELGISLRMLTILINEPYRFNIAQIQVISSLTKKNINEISDIIGKIPFPEVIKQQKPRLSQKRLSQKRRVFLTPAIPVQ